MTHEIVNDFNVGMREWFEAGHCGLTHVVDVYNMTGAKRKIHYSPAARVQKLLSPTALELLASFSTGLQNK